MPGRCHGPTSLPSSAIPSWFTTMASQVDVLVAAAPHTPLTERMFDERVFRSMKKTAYFLALSRGTLFDDVRWSGRSRAGGLPARGSTSFRRSRHPRTIPSSTVRTSS